MAFDHCGIFHSRFISGVSGVLGSVISTLCPVALTIGMWTLLASAVAHRRASAPPPVSIARLSPVRWSYQRGDITHEELPPSRSRFWGLGIVVWFHGWRRSTGLPSGSLGTNVSSLVQSS